MRKQTFLPLLLLWGILPLRAQEPVPNIISGKSAIPLNHSTNNQSTNNQTRAVVVGISDYQDPAIPDLQFAHRDAEAFAAWLHSPAGGSVPAENIQLLLNEKATLGRVAMALDALRQQSKAGDQAIIFFSGHADVESVTFSQPGFLLCWDAPATVYYAGGTLQLGMLQEIISTLSLQNKARVLMITDACHAGRLAGSEVGGPQATTGNLARQFANEVKILSCQPGEFSLEGTQWGGGRGCFSYHLTDGLYGLADRNGDDLVTLFELESYLAERVPEETAPHRQFPFAVGDKMARLARVDAPTLAKIKAVKAGAQPTLEPIDPRGMVDWALTGADSSIRELYAAFNTALERKELLEPKGTSADNYYRRLIVEPELEPLHGLMTRNFAAALLDESQQVTNKLLKTDPYVVSDINTRPFVFDHVPDYLARAVEILGEDHFIYRHLKTMQYFFAGKTCTPDKHPGLSPDSVARLAARHYEQALQYDSSAAYVHVELGFLRFYVFLNFDLAWRHAQKALDLSPNWVYANYLAGNSLRPTNPRQGEVYLLKAIALDSTFLLPYQELVWNYLSQRIPEKSDRYDKLYIQKVKSLIASNPENMPVYYRFLLGGALWRTGQPEEAKEVLLTAEVLSKGQSFDFYQYLCAVYTDLGQYDEALAAAKKELVLAPGNGFGLGYLISKLHKLQASGELAEVLEIAVPLSVSSPNYQWFIALLAEAYLELGQPEKAQPLFRKILDLPPVTYEYLEVNYRGRAWLGLGNREAMEQTIEDALRRWPDESWVYYHAACLYALAKDEPKALEWLERVLESGLHPYEQYSMDFDLGNIRESPGFKALMKKYFPDQVKD